MYKYIYRKRKNRFIGIDNDENKRFIGTKYADVVSKQRKSKIVDCYESILKPVVLAIFKVIYVIVMILAVIFVMTSLMWKVVKRPNSKDKNLRTPVKMNHFNKNSNNGKVYSTRTRYIK